MSFSQIEKNKQFASTRRRLFDGRIGRFDRGTSFCRTKEPVIYEMAFSEFCFQHNDTGLIDGPTPVYCVYDVGAAE